MTATFHTCPKCEGKGEIAAFKNVLGGVCFCCAGSGKKAGKAPAKSQKWAFCANGEAYVYRKAKTESAALKMAKAFFSAASSKELRAAEVSVRTA